METHNQTWANPGGFVIACGRVNAINGQAVNSTEAYNEAAKSNTMGTQIQRSDGTRILRGKRWKPNQYKDDFEHGTSRT